jgi:hypothetical protein
MALRQKSSAPEKNRLFLQYRQQTDDTLRPHNPQTSLRGYNDMLL